MLVNVPNVQHDLRVQVVHTMIPILKVKQMPNPTQIRERRINELLHSFDKTPEFIDIVILRANVLFPLVRYKTRHDYAEAVWSIMKAQEK